jgi:membrane glycosyltransferase
LGEWMAKKRLFAIPEEIETPAIIAKVQSDFKG